MGCCNLNCDHIKNEEPQILSQKEDSVQKEKSKKLLFGLLNFIVGSFTEVKNNILSSQNNGVITEDSHALKAISAFKYEDNSPNFFKIVTKTHKITQLSYKKHHLFYSLTQNLHLF